MTEKTCTTCEGIGELYSSAKHQCYPCPDCSTRTSMTDEQLAAVEAALDLAFKHLTIVLDGRAAQDVIRDLIAMVREHQAEKKYELPPLRGMSPEEVVQKYPKTAIEVIRTMQQHHEEDMYLIQALKTEIEKLRDVYGACQNMLSAVYLGDGKILCPPVQEQPLRNLVATMAAYKNREEPTDGQVPRDES